jgi:hypothetical protein
MSVSHITQGLLPVLTISNLQGSRGVTLLLNTFVQCLLASFLVLLLPWPSVLQFPTFAIRRVGIDGIEKRKAREGKMIARNGRKR